MDADQAVKWKKRNPLYVWMAADLVYLTNFSNPNTNYISGSPLTYTHSQNIWDKL